jgi:hypothetical protein
MGMRNWVAVAAAHPASGASTVALTLADALASARAVSLVEFARRIRSGLAGCATAELGVDGSACWRRGTRGGVTIIRRTTDDRVGWPEIPADNITVADVGAIETTALDALTLHAHALVVCRASVPGLRAAEQMIVDLPTEQPAAVVAVGSTQLTGVATASLGRRLRQLAAEGRIVGIPDVPRYRVTGPSAAPLPQPIAAAGARLAALIGLAPDDDRARRRRLPRIGRNIG